MARQGAIGVEELIRRKVANIRHWNLTKLGKKRRKWGFEFTVMTYNILSQKAIDNHIYLYRNCNPLFLEEDYRISRIMPEILKSKSDVICLQEVEQHLFYNRIKKVFDSNGFGSIFKKRTGAKTDGCAILWRKTKFNLLNYHDVEFRTADSKLLDRDNVGLIAVLKPNHPKAEEMQLHVATTHLLFNPRRGDIKLCQLRLLLAELEKMALKKVLDESRFYHPVILCGDFNFEPHSPLYQFVETGHLDIMNRMSGDMSGQAEGKNKGRFVNGVDLSLHGIGISENSRFEPTSQNGDSSSGPFSTTESFQTKTEGVNKVSADANLIAAIGSSTDPRWITTLGTLGKMQLLNEIASRIETENKAIKKRKQNSETEPTNSGEPDINQPFDIQKNLQASELAPAATSSDSETTNQHFNHDFHFMPVYKYYQNSKDFPVTSMMGNDCNTVDHIFYNVKRKESLNSFVENQLKLIGRYSLMHVADLLDLDGLPNACLGSDHIFLMAKFVFSFK